jgi:fructokinase
MRIGVDLGGTKTEALAIADNGEELLRHRVDTPREYWASIEAIAGLVRKIETETGQTATVGVGMPGTVVARTGLIKNANSTWLNGMPLPVDLSHALGREVRLANDANCLAVSEATDGAAAGKNVVFGVILGTGCGGGVSFQGNIHNGPNGVAGEWGHNPLPWATGYELPGPLCFCGKRGCLEKWISGTGVAEDFHTVTGRTLTTREIVVAAEAGDAEAAATVARFEDRLARALASLVHTLDPDVIVFGGGLSQVARLYQDLPAQIEKYLFGGGQFDTPLLPAKFGDSSGVRGAAWLWPA